MFLMGAVAEIKAKDVCSRLEQSGDLFLRRIGRSQRRRFLQLDFGAWYVILQSSVKTPINFEN